MTYAAIKAAKQPTEVFLEISQNSQEKPIPDPLKDRLMQI